ncbi:BQ2448_7543 [Microbotryum intermedium]|uniref:BQ2448_7543 protein n=1 Tax=Microbotryum intermedium TaxID=269621 RepID=A0A238FRN3_9BASI|nr:BQ2448_7543 [Microbotryum intermedium]
MYEPSHDATSTSVLEPIAADREDLLRSPVAPFHALEMTTSTSILRPWTEDEDFTLVYAIALHGETEWERVMSERAVDVDPDQDHPEGAFPARYLSPLRERRSMEDTMSRWANYWSSRFVEIEGHDYIFSALFAGSREVEEGAVDRICRDVDLRSLPPIPTLSTGPTDSDPGRGLPQPHRPRSKSLGTINSINPTLTLTQATSIRSTSSPMVVPVSVPSVPRLRTALDPLRGGGRQRRQGFALHPPLSSSPLKQTIHGYDDAQPTSPTRGDEENHPALNRFVNSHF